MANDMRRAALAVLCVFAVVLGASMFPAAGYGANPVPDSGADAGGAGPDDDSGGGSDATEPTTSTAVEPDTATTTAASDDGGVGTETTETTTTTTTTTTRRETTTAAPGSDAASEGGLLGSLLSLATILLAVLIGFLAVTVGLGRHHRRRYPGQWDLPDAPHLRLVAYVRRVPQTSLSFVMFAGMNAPGIVDALASGVGDATRGVGSAASGLGAAMSTVGAAFARVPAGFLAGVGGFARALTSLSLPSLSVAGAGSLFGSGGEDRPGSDPRSGGRTAPAPDDDPEPPEPPASVQEAWERLQEDLGVTGADGRTPGQIARGAISRGMPADAVRSLTRTFREVRYGGRPDDGERVTTAREAYERIRSALQGDSS